MGRNVDDQGLANYGGVSVKGEQLEAVCSPIGGGPEADMRQINQYALYELGDTLAGLKRLSGNVPLQMAFVPLLNARSQIWNLLQGRIIEITFARHDAIKLQGQIDDLMTRHFHNEKGELDSNKDWLKEEIPGWEMGAVRSALETFEHTLSAELRQATTYYIPRIGIYDTAKLVENAEQHIDTDLRKLMDETAVKDFAAAGRCLALDLPTSSGFHAARAVESVLATYFHTFAGANADTPGNGTMGDYLTALETIDSAVKPEAKTLRTIREIAKLDRNPVMHPRDTLEAQEAAIFFNLATAAIMAMTREIATRKAGGTQLQLVSDAG